MNLRQTLLITLLIFTLAACNSSESIQPTDDPAGQLEEVDNTAAIETEIEPLAPVAQDEPIAPVIVEPAEEVEVEAEPETEPIEDDVAAVEAEDVTSAEPVTTPPPVEDDQDFLPVVTTPEQQAVLATSITLEEVGSGYVNPVYLTHAGDERLFVVEQNGYISLLENGEIVQPPFLDIDDSVGSNGFEQGLLSVAFHPNFTDNNRFFVYYTNNGGDTVVSEFGMSNDPSLADVNSERIIMEVEQPFGNHNGGQLKFGNDGYLYIGLGDGGSGGDPENNGLDPSTLLGSILRIDVDGAQPYAVPADNPFVGDSDKLDEIWSWGLRNPWRFSFDRLTNDMFIGDVGQNKYEEISFEAADSTGGINFGWNAFEGFNCFNDKCNTVIATEPILEYEHNGEGGCSVSGGYVYRGTSLDKLWGNYIYGDFCSGKVWASVASADGSWQSQVVLESGAGISSFGEDFAGNLYLVDRGGLIYRVNSAE